MFAIPTLCYFALPVCKPLKIPTPEFICQEVDYFTNNFTILEIKKHVLIYEWF